MTGPNLIPALLVVVVFSTGQSGTATAQVPDPRDAALRQQEVNDPAPFFLRPTFSIDPTVGPSGLSLPELRGQERPVAFLADFDSRYAFIENEIIIATDDDEELLACLTRCNGTVLRVWDPRHLSQNLRPHYLIRVDPPTLDSSRLPSLVTYIGYSQGGHWTFSSDLARNLFTLAAQEFLNGVTIDLNWVGGAAQFRGRVTTEDRSGPHLGPNPYTRNAFKWTTHSTGSVQDIGVGEAWRILAINGRLNKRIKLAIIDQGFSIEPDLPWLVADSMENVDPLAPIGVNSSGIQQNYTHGTNVASAAMAIPNNSVGAAGPGGPVVNEGLLIYVLPDVFSLRLSISHAVSCGAQIINYSRWHRLPKIGAWYRDMLSEFDETMRALRHRNVLFVAIAGNDGKELSRDIRDKYEFPCQNEDVLCVGGIKIDSKYRAGQSNYGRDVDIFAPYDVYVGSDSQNPDVKVFRGTSAAAPFVAGVAALVWAADPSLTADEVEDILMDTAHSSPDDTVPRYVNARAAVVEALLRSGLAPMSLSISAPRNGRRISRGRVSVTLLADALDLDEGPPSNVKWTSDLEGVIGEGRVSAHIFQTVGVHTITAEARDAEGNTARDAVQITVVNDPPILSIQNPVEGSRFARNESIPVTGLSYDLNDFQPLGDLQVHWRVGAQRVEQGHEGTIPPNLLTSGMHQLEFVGDDGETVATRSVTINITPPTENLPPLAYIRGPGNGSWHYVNARDARGAWFVELELTGEATDPGVVGPLPGDSLRWRVKAEGGRAVDVGTGTRVRHRFYSESFTTRYTVTLIATDSGGKEGRARIQVNIIILS